MNHNDVIALMEVFPFAIAVDADLRVLRSGALISRTLPNLRQGALLTQWLTMRGVGDNAQDFASLRQQAGRTALLSHADGCGLTFKGEWRLFSEDTGAIFLGWPWVKDADELFQWGFSLNEIPAHNPLGDMLLVMTTNKNNLADARELTARLESRSRMLEDAIDSFQRVFEASPNAMLLVNSSGAIEMANSQTEALLGYTIEELLGSPVDLLVPEHQRADHGRYLSAMFAAPHTRRMTERIDIRAEHRDGHLIPVEIALNPMEIKGRTVMLASVSDITERTLREQRINAALREKDLLLQEIHHRVKNNLQVVQSLLALEAGRFTDPAVKAMLADSQNRMQSMALIHQSLYQSKDFGEVNLREFLEQLIPNLVNSFAIDSSRIQIELAISDAVLSINKAVPCGLLANELITNVFKHAFPKGRAGTVNIALQRVGADRAQLSITDDGVGMDDHIDPETADTLGISLIHLLARQLNGTLTISRRSPTRFSVEFPLNESSEACS